MSDDYSFKAAATARFKAAATILAEVEEGYLGSNLKSGAHIDSQNEIHRRYLPKNAKSRHKAYVKIRSVNTKHSISNPNN